MSLFYDKIKEEARRKLELPLNQNSWTPEQKKRYDREVNEMVKSRGGKDLLRRDGASDEEQRAYDKWAEKEAMHSPSAMDDFSDIGGGGYDNDYQADGYSPDQSENTRAREDQRERMRDEYDQNENDLNNSTNENENISDDELLDKQSKDPESNNNSDDTTNEQNAESGEATKKNKPQQGDYDDGFSEHNGYNLSKSAQTLERNAAKNALMDSAEAEALVATAPEWGTVALAIIGGLLVIILLIIAFNAISKKYGADECGKEAAAAAGSVIVIDPGHPSENDSSTTQTQYDADEASWKANKTGANGGASGNGVIERVVNQQVSEYLKQELEAKGYTVYLTKNDSETFMSNRARGKFAKDKGAAMIIKVHNDAYGASPDGIVFYSSNSSVIKSKWDNKNELGDYYIRREDNIIAEDKKIANALLDAFKSSGISFPSSTQSHSENRGFGYTHNIPTSLIELSNLVTKSNADFIKNTANQKKVAKAIADGVAAYSPAKGESGGAAIRTDLGQPNSGGYYLLPESPYYKLNVNGGSPRDVQWGGKTLIQTILATGQTWSAKNPTQLFGVGDLNSSGHGSHKTGIDVDIYSDNKLFMSRPGNHTGNNSSYDRALTVELAKTFIATGTIDTIFYSDTSVNDEVNKYINQNKLKGKMAYEDDHDDHFHVRVVDGLTPVGGVPTGTKCKPSEEERSTIDPVSGDLAALQNKFKQYINSGKITQQTIGDPDGDVASGKVKPQTIRTAIQMADFLSSKGKKLEISVMVTGHKPGTLHEVGLAFDIGDESVANILMPWAKDNSSTLKLDELIFDNTLINKSGNAYNLKNGSPFSYGQDTLSGHRNHIHVGVKE